MAVIARMIGILFSFAFGTVIAFPAHHLRSALQDGTDGLEVGRRHLIPILGKIRFPEKMEQIGEAHLDHIVHDAVNC